MKDQLPEVESQSAFARRLGTTRQYVGKLAGHGLPLKDGKVDVAAALDWIAANVNRRSGDGSGGTLNDAQTELILVKTDIARVQLERARKEVIDRHVAKKAVVNLMRMVRDGVLNFPSRYGPDIAAKVGCDPRDLTNELEAQMREMLNGLEASRSLFDE